MMPTLLHSARPTARKPHRCDCCTGDIPVGEPYSRDTLVWDGRVYDWKTCVPCESLENVVWQWSSATVHDGLTADDYIEWARDHLTDSAYGADARALLVRAGRLSECELGAPVLPGTARFHVGDTEFAVLPGPVATVPARKEKRRG